MAAAPAARAPKALMDELIEEIILRLPPAEPASLVRAALVCKPWRGLISSSRFRRRFRAFHRTAPTLGHLLNIWEGHGDCVARFVPTIPVRQPCDDLRDSFTCDARHGRVLVCTWAEARPDRALLVWNPMTNERWQLPSQPYLMEYWSAAVLCAAIGACDHLDLDCPRGAFLVVALTTISRKVTLWVYSSEAGTWRNLADVDFEFSVDMGPPTLVPNTLYFLVNRRKMIFSYDLESSESSVIHAPPMSDRCATVVATILITISDGGLGVARFHEDARFSIWSMQANPNGEKGWTQIKVIELVKLLSMDARSICSGFAILPRDDSLIFMRTNDGLFTVDLKSGLKKKVCEELRNKGRLDVFQYTSFYTPALGPPAASAGEGPSSDSSSASKGLT